LSEKCKEDEPLVPYEITESPINNMDESLQPEATSEAADKYIEVLLLEAISESSDWLLTHQDHGGKKTSTRSLTEKSQKTTAEVGLASNMLCIRIVYV